MAATFTIGGVSFAAMSNTDGRKAISCLVAAPVVQKIRRHIPGSDGNLIIFAGRTARPIICTMRYIGAYPGIWATIKSDQDAWAGVDLTIVDENGTSYERMTLDDMRPLKRSQGMGHADGKGFIDVVASFTQD